MKKIGWFSGLADQQPTLVMMQRIAGGMGTVLLLTAGICAAQEMTPTAPSTPPDGYTVHQTADVGGRISSKSGSGAMYDTLVNLQSGPRVQGETFELRALPGKKHTLVDSLMAVGNGFGGDPNNFAKLSVSKDGIYDFSGLFRRDRQYFDYDLLGNPNIPSSVLSIPYGKSSGVPTSAYVPWQQVNQSPVMFNTVRRMTDTNLTLYPQARVSYRAGYSQNIFQGPTLSPGESVGKYDSLLQEYQRNSNDDFTGGVDWKPVRGTHLSFDEEIDHYKEGSYFTLAPSDFIAQEADGTPVSLGDWDSLTPYGIGACNTGSMGSSAYTNSTNYTIFSAPQTTGGLPIINPACDVVTSYMRSQPTRILYPTEAVRLQSSSIKNVEMNGDFRYTLANMNLPNYYENFQGLDGTVRAATFTGSAKARRAVVAADYGLVWQAMKTFTLSEQIDYSNVHQPGWSNITEGITANTPSNPNETINFAGQLVPGSNLSVEGSPNGSLMPAYFGQRLLTNNLTGSWDATPRATFALTYRYRTHMIAENAYGTGDIGGNPGNTPLAPGATTNGTVTIHENGGIFNAALRPTDHWNINGTVEALYDDNVFTPMGARQTRHYRVHTTYKPRPWATLSGAWNDLERHNNTNNNQATVALFTPPSGIITPKTPTGTASTGTPYEGPLDHVDSSRVVSLGAALTPNEHYGFDLNYAYSDVYMASNICYLNGAAGSALPGAVQSATSTVCPNVWGRGATGVGEASGTSPLSDWFARDFMDAPTQYGSMALSLSPAKTFHSNLGFRVSDVRGNQFFNDARAVNGSLHSFYQSPFLNVAWTVRPGWIWKAEYNYYGYGEAGPSGSPYCSTSTSTAAEATIVPCNSNTLTGPTGLTEPVSGLTAPRDFHANNVTLGMHYDF
jgi:hypothetical protein